MAPSNAARSNRVQTGPRLATDNRVMKLSDVELRCKVAAALSSPHGVFLQINPKLSHSQPPVKDWGVFWDKFREAGYPKSFMDLFQGHRRLQHPSNLHAFSSLSPMAPLCKLLVGIDKKNEEILTQLSAVVLDDAVKWTLHDTTGQRVVTNGPFYVSVDLTELDNATAKATITFYILRERIASGASADRRNEMSTLGSGQGPGLMSTLFPNHATLGAVMKDVRKLVEKLNAKKFSTNVLMERLERPGDMPESPTPPGLEGELRPFQRQSLHFMLQEERNPKGIERHLWHQLDLPSGTTLYYSPLMKTITLQPPGPASTGGFLCEEMGLGKTVETLALVLANPYDDEAGAQSIRRMTKGTLVICPVSLVGQWIQEAKKFTPQLSVYMYHGSGRSRDPAKLATFDIVVTTYQTLGADYSQWTKAQLVRKSPPMPALTNLHWHRVVLDESHSIKNKKGAFTRACLQLEGTHRWCATGTPFTSNLSDLEGQLAFLRMHPFATEPASFKKYILNTLESALHTSDYHRRLYSTETAFAIHLLQQCTVRHVKTNTVGGVKVLSLPPRIDRSIMVELSPQERTLYEKVASDSLASFRSIERGGDTALMKATFRLHSLMLPLRQICGGEPA